MTTRDLDPARGVLVGAVAGAVFWLVACVAYAVWRMATGG